MLDGMLEVIKRRATLIQTEAITLMVLAQETAMIAI